MANTPEPPSIPISALQHHLYCPRQCALIHVERQWAENAATAEGRVLHARADAPGGQRRRAVRSVNAMPLVQPALGIHGQADVVEFHRASPGQAARVVPVEYKRGRPKAHRADEVQLCAQALCLEHMLCTQVPEGELFYGQLRQRQTVRFDSALRQLTHATIAQVRSMIEQGCTPPARYAARRCDACSLIDVCQPKLLERGNSVAQWLRRTLQADAAAATQDGDA